VIELSLSPEEAYDRLRRIVVEVNGIMSLFRSEQYLTEADLMMAHAVYDDDDDEAGEGAGEHEGEEGQLPTQNEEDVFSPSKGNVVFASAIDAWGFRVQVGELAG
jgi:ribosome assembly protein 1